MVTRKPTAKGQYTFTCEVFDSLVHTVICKRAPNFGDDEEAEHEWYVQERSRYHANPDALAEDVKALLAAT